MLERRMRVLNERKKTVGQVVMYAKFTIIPPFYFNLNVRGIFYFYAQYIKVEKKE